jgi:hypothetical protein
MNHPIVPTSAVHFTASNPIAPAKYNKQGTMTKLRAMSEMFFGRFVCGDFQSFCDDICVDEAQSTVGKKSLEKGRFACAI